MKTRKWMCKMRSGDTWFRFARIYDSQYDYNCQATPLTWRVPGPRTVPKYDDFSIQP